MSNMPWQMAEIPGPKKGLPLQRPETLFAILKKSKRTILIVGHRAVEMDVGDQKLIDYIIELACKGDIQVIATAHIVGEFIKREFTRVTSMPAMDVANRLRDPNWEGLDGAGPYDLALFVGLPYQMGWTILSGLKNSPKLKTINIDGFFQPNASFSTPNISPLVLKDFLNTLIEKLGEM